MERSRATGAWVLPLGLVGVPAALGCAAMLVTGTGAFPSRFCWDVAWTAGAFSALSGMLLARRTAVAANRSRWSLWAAAAACWLAGQLAWDVFGVVGFPASPNLADAGWWAFAGLVIVSLARSRALSRSVRVVATVETLPVIGAALAVTYAELWHDASMSSLAPLSRFSALVYPAVYVAAAVLMLQAMIGGSLRRSRSVALRLVLGGMAAQALAFCLWSEQLLDRTYVPGATLLDPLWLLGMVAIGAGGALAGLRPEPFAEIDEPSKRGGVLPATMFTLLFAALIQARISRFPVGAEITLAAGLLFSGAALVARGTLLERRLREMLARERVALASLAAREGELAGLNARLVEESRRDPLTGMRNRRALSDDLPLLEAEHRARGEAFALALCDIDHFKAYNDRLGHLAGDQALRSIAATVRGALRAGDVAYRFGGEELLLVMREAGRREALAAAERVRAAVQRAAIPHPDGIGGVLTVSMGVAAGLEASSTLLARADTALYAAKHAGRNRAVAATDAQILPSAGRHHAVAEEPVPRHLRSMLAVSRAAVSGHGITPVLEALAETIRSELSFQVVAVNLLDAARHELTCTVVLGDDEARQALLGTTNPWSEWQALMGSEHQRRGAIWLPAGSHEWEGETVTWTPAAAAAPDPDAWHPDDMLLLPLRGADGEVLAVVSVDQPLGGRRPDDGELTFLMAVADHAGLALEQCRRETADTTAAPEQSPELRLAAVMLLAETLDLRDPSTARHSRTVAGYARQTALALGLAPERIERIHAAGVLHDLGKLGIADAILFKSGPLDEAERREVERHPEIGARILEHAGLREIATWVRAHHERLDGFGYPDRLSAAEITVEARILAVADAYEAMIADRPYRSGVSAAEACEELLRHAGSQFDPVVVEAFIGTLRQTGELGAERLRSAA